MTLEILLGVLITLMADSMMLVIIAPILTTNTQSFTVWFKFLDRRYYERRGQSSSMG